MKIILTAFGGKLKSEVMDWDTRWTRDIRLRLDIPRPRTFDIAGPLPTDMLTEHVCIFEESGNRYPIQGDPMGALEYRLVDYK